jgi:hypothetical protein
VKKRALFLLVLFSIPALVFVSACGSTFGNDSGSNTKSSNIDIDAGPNEIEIEYAQTGPYATSSLRVEKEEVGDEYGLTIFYPVTMIPGYHPIITWGNGTDAKTSSYRKLLDHLSSWGFVVVATDCEQTISGEEMIAGLNYLIEQNYSPGSPFYNKLDTSKIGATGHSQGGGGTINAANDPRVVCSAPLAPAQANEAGIKGPMLLIAGQLDNLVPPAFVKRTTFDDATVPTLFAIRKLINHLNFAGEAEEVRGYLTAWFRYQLQDDGYAASAFVGECEICLNPRWIVNTDKWFSD